MLAQCELIHNLPEVSRSIRVVQVTICGTNGCGGNRLDENHFMPEFLQPKDILQHSPGSSALMRVGGNHAAKQNLQFVLPDINGGLLHLDEAEHDFMLLGDLRKKSDAVEHEIALVLDAYSRPVVVRAIRRTLTFA